MDARRRVRIPERESPSRKHRSISDGLCLDILKDLDALARLRDARLAGDERLPLRSKGGGSGEEEGLGGGGGGRGEEGEERR